MFTIIFLHYLTKTFKNDLNIIEIINYQSNVVNWQLEIAIKCTVEAYHVNVNRCSHIFSTTSKDTHNNPEIAAISTAIDCVIRGTSKPSSYSTTSFGYTPNMSMERLRYDVLYLRLSSQERQSTHIRILLLKFCIHILFVSFLLLYLSYNIPMKLIYFHA